MPQFVRFIIGGCAALMRAERSHFGRGMRHCATGRSNLAWQGETPLRIPRQELHGKLIHLSVGRQT
jgi:hypothetical protein